MKFMYKFSKSVLPCLLLTLCIGFTYAFSIFADPFAAALGASRQAVQFSFCLNILLLGLGAAFFGPMVERRIKAAAAVSGILLASGLLVSTLAVQTKNIWLLYLGFGVMCGLSEGCGYVVPVKNLLLWFGRSRNKGVVSALSIISFGLGATVCSWLFKLFYPSCGIEWIFAALAAVYAVPCALATVLIDKPRYAKTGLSSFSFSYSEYARDPFFRRAWLFMFLNISMGLVFIGSCAGILKEAGIGQDAAVSVVALCGAFNGGGRLVFPWLSDFMKNRLNIWAAVLVLEIAAMAAPMLAYSICIPAAVVLCNATYGAGFSTLPSVLSDHYGNGKLSAIHGFCLSAWGCASVFAYVVTSVCLKCMSGYRSLVYVLAAVYALNLLNVVSAKKLFKGGTK